MVGEERCPDEAQYRRFRSLSGWRPDLLKKRQCYKRPKTNLSQNEKYILINIELPGIEKEDININLSRTKLDIHAEKKIKSTKTKKDSVETTIDFQGFHRTIKLPPDADVNNSEANWKNYRLLIKIPKLKVNYLNQGKLNIN